MVDCTPRAKFVTSAYMKSIFEDERSTGDDAEERRVVIAQLLQLLMLRADDVAECRSFSLQFTRLVASQTYKQARGAYWLWTLLRTRRIEGNS